VFAIEKTRDRVARFMDIRCRKEGGLYFLVLVVMWLDRLANEQARHPSAGIGFHDGASIAIWSVWESANCGAGFDHLPVESRAIRVRDGAKDFAHTGPEVGLVEDVCPVWPG